MPELKKSGMMLMDMKRFSARSVRLIKSAVRNTLLSKNIKASVKVYANDQLHTVVEIDGWMIPKYKQKFFRVFFFVNGDVIQHFKYTSPEPDVVIYENEVSQDDNVKLSVMTRGLLDMMMKNHANFTDIQFDVHTINEFNLKISELLSELQPTIDSLYSDFERTK